MPAVMRQVRTVAIPLAAVCRALALCCWLETAQAAPLAVFGSLPNLEDMALSPDGARLAFVRTDEDTRVIAIADLASNKLLGEMRAGETKLRAIYWADNDRLLITISSTEQPADVSGRKIEWYMLLVYDLKTHKSTRIPDVAQFRDVNIMNTVSSAPTVRQIGGHTVVFVTGEAVSDSRLVPALFRADLDKGAQRLVRQGGPSTGDWLVDEAGELAAQSEYYEREQRWVLKISRGGHLQEVALTRAPINVPSILGFGPAPDSLLLSAIEDGDPVWRLVSLKDGKVGEPMPQRHEVEIPFENPQTHRMIGGVHRDDVPHYVFFDPGLQQRWAAILRAFPDEHVRFVSASADFQKILVEVEGTRDGYQFELVDLSARRADSMGRVYSDLETVLPKERLTYKAADGLEIPAYLTLPAGRPPKSLPLVVLVHGGPAARDTAEFDWWSQALASQGYAVLQPNYRGSALETRFLEAGFGQFGRKMQTDLSDGVRHLVKEGIVDPARVCIAGGSYGGYAALAGAALDPGVYRCAVSVAGISDIRRWLESEEPDTQFDRRAVRYWDRFLGVTGPKDPVVETISPIRHIDAVNIPVLLIHGKDDTVVPYEQSVRMNDALRNAGKAVEMVTLAHEDHWLSRSQTRRQMLETSVRFLREHNPPD